MKKLFSFFIAAMLILSFAVLADQAEADKTIEVTDEGKLSVTTVDPSVTCDLSDDGLACKNTAETNQQMCHCQTPKLQCFKVQEIGEDSVTAECPVETMATGGGGYCYSNSIRRSVPSGSRGWNVACTNDDPYSPVKAYVKCCYIDLE